MYSLTGQKGRIPRPDNRKLTNLLPASQIVNDSYFEQTLQRVTSQETENIDSMFADESHLRGPKVKKCL